MLYAFFVATQTALITLLQSSTVYVPNLTSYQMTLEVTSSQSITKNVFVKQRVRTSSNNFNDIFVAIATPNQIETLGVGAPTSDTSYFLDYQICILANTVEYLNSVLEEILQELKNLVTDVELLQNTAEGSVYIITSGDVQVNNYTNDTLYRLPLIALPCGTPVNTDGVITIPEPNVNTPGWLPCAGGDPAGYFFKYNIALDSNLPTIYPAAVPKLTLAYVEENGIALTGDVLFTSTGIYWNSNVYGSTPWPRDYINSSNVGGLTSETQVVLLLSIVV